MKKYKAIAIQAAPLALVGGVALLGLLALSASPALAHSLEFRGNGNAFIKSIAAPLEVHVNGNGRVLVRGAEVVSVGSGGVITAENALGGSTLVWTIQTDEDTQFLSLAGETTSVGDISVGDLISFRGTIDETASNFTVNADIVKNWSDTKNIEVSGKVESVNTADGTFVLKVRGREVNVEVTNDTTMTLDGSAAVLADLDEDYRVAVAGVFTHSEGLLTAASVMAHFEELDEDEDDDDDDDERNNHRGRGHDGDKRDNGKHRD